MHSSCVVLSSFVNSFLFSQAMSVQLITAFGAITGCAISLWAAEAYGDLSDTASTAPVSSFSKVES